MMHTYITHPSWDAIDQLINDLYHQIKAKGVNYTTLIGLSRGGLIAAVKLSHLLDIPLTPVCYSSKSGAGDDKNHSNVLPILTDESVLIVDDIMDSGLTVHELVDFYANHNYVDTATLYFKESSCIAPTFKGITIPHDSPFIYFPWEEYFDYSNGIGNNTQ